MCRILMIAPTPFFADRGCHVRIQGEARALRAVGCDVLVCTYHHGRDVEGVETARIQSLPWYTNVGAGPDNSKYVADVLLTGLALRRGLRWKPDVVHGHLHEGALIGSVVARALRRPLVFDYQGSLTDELTAHEYVPERGLRRRIFGRLERFIDRRPDHVICSSGRAAAGLEGRVPAHRLTTVLDGVDTMRFRPLPTRQRTEVRRRLGIPDDTTVALYVGVLNRYQGIDLLLQHVASALEAHPSLVFLLAGYPETVYAERVRSMGLQDRVWFTGRVPFEQTPALTAAADIALSPKTSATEGNLKLLNYAACGLPVVVFDSEVNREILGPAGEYVPMGDGEGFVARVAELARTPERRAALGRAARRRAREQLSWERAACEILDVYEGLGVPTDERNVSAPPSPFSSTGMTDSCVESAVS